MEGAGLFALAGSRMDTSMIAAVHTRRVIDPKAGLKLTGSMGRMQFGALSALDASSGFDESSADRAAEGDRLFNVARYSLSASNYTGAIATDMESDTSFNRVGGPDLSWRVGANQRITGMMLYSSSRDTGASNTRQGFAASGSWGYNTRRQQIAGFVEHYDRDFRMDTAFYNRGGMTNGWA